MIEALPQAGLVHICRDHEETQSYLGAEAMWVLRCKSMVFRTKETYLQILVLSPSICVTLDQVVNIFEPQFPRSELVGLLWLTYNRYSVGGNLYNLLPFLTWQLPRAILESANNCEVAIILFYIGKSAKLLSFWYKSEYCFFFFFDWQKKPLVRKSKNEASMNETLV